MTTTPEGPLKEVWNLYMEMTEELAIAHGNAMYVQKTIDDGWDTLSARISTAKSDLAGIAGPTDTHKERKASRHERKEIEGVDEILDETYSSLLGRASAQTNYLTLEAGVKAQMADGGSGDLVGLDQAREKISQESQMLQSNRSSLSYRIENLASEAGV